MLQDKDNSFQKVKYTLKMINLNTKDQMVMLVMAKTNDLERYIS
jgi:hypothetical protein